ncbi:hypothetical protein BH11ACT7_BH11ACT7_25870 [soil metagenome]
MTAPNPVFRCGSAEVRASSRYLATVVEVRGRVTTANLAGVLEHTQRFLLCDTPVILDLSELDSIAPEGAALLVAIDDASTASNVEWAVIIGWAARAIFDVTVRERMLPVRDSVTDALHEFADARRVRRELLLPIVLNSA